MKREFYTVTENENTIMKSRTDEVLQKVAGCSSLTIALIDYAGENGYEREEAEALVKERVIPTVDKYNEMCRECAENEESECIQDMINERVAELSVEEECKYKLGLIIALKNLNKEILQKEALRTAEEMNVDFEEMTNEEIAVLEKGEYSEEKLSQINNELVRAIENSGLELQLSGAMAEFIEGDMNAENIQSFVTDMWKDEQLKYCVAVAACVARKNGELPSIPAEATDEAFIIGVCQGVDVANVEKKVALGKMAAENAYKILRIVAMVGAALLAAALAGITMIFAGAAILSATISLFGEMIVPLLVAGALAGVLCIGIGGTAIEMIQEAVDFADHACECTKESIVKTSKKIHEVVSERVVPAIRRMVDAATTFTRDMFTRVRKVLKGKRVENAMA